MNIVTLNNGVKMPQLGFGVWQVKEGTEVKDAVKCAIENGYRSIDTAMIYHNEEGVGEGIRESGIAREELFITTKVWNKDQGYEETLQAFDESLKKLGLDYIDLYLIHWPTPQHNKYIETYRALEKLYEDGKVRAIGVCNFHIHHLEEILKNCNVKPVVNQVECHPYFSQTELKTFCDKHEIYLEAWSPLMQGGKVLEDEVIKEIAAKHEKTPAQVVLRWHLQRNAIVIPKSITPSRIKENFDVFDFELTVSEMEQINSLDQGKRVGPDPDEFHVM